MKKKSIALIVVFIFCIVFSFPVFASNKTPVADDAGLLTISEKNELSAKLSKISSEQQLDVVVVTVKSTNGKSTQSFTDDYYIDNGYGYGTNKDGILFLVSMDDRKWHMSTKGYGITAITDESVYYIFNQMSDDLKSGNYYKAFDKYADLCEKLVKQAKADTDSSPKEPFNIGRNILIALCSGLCVATVVTFICYRPYTKS